MIRTTLCLSLLALACAHARPASSSGGYDAELSQYAYPFEVRFHPVQSQGQKLQMAYMDVAPEKPNGTTVLLLHGKNFSGAYWEPTIRALTERGFRVIAPDQIGFGKSSKPTDFQYSFHELATRTRELLDSLNVSRVVVVGHSMGGMLATRFALSNPDRTEKLVLVNPIGLEDWQRVVPYRTIDQNVAAELKNTPEGVKAYMQDSYFAGQWKPEYDRLVDIQAGWILGPDRERMAKVSALTTDMVFTQPVVQAFPDVKVPTLLIIGQRDRTAIGKAWAPEAVKPTLGNYPELGRKAAAAIPGSKLVELEGVGHAPQVEAFDAYLKALVGFITP